MNVRDKVFETNSSSSHSVTVSEHDLLDLTFNDIELRNGVIWLEPHECGYGDWRQFRYILPDNKLAYLIILSVGGSIDLDRDVFDGESIDVLPHLLNHPRFDFTELKGLINFIREESGCELRFTMDYETASEIHMSEEVLDLTPMLAEKETLRRLLFSSNSWIENSRDDSYLTFDRWVDSDMGKTLRNPHVYLNRSLPERFEIYFVDKRIVYSDSTGAKIEGVMSFGKATTFLDGMLGVNAHIVGLQVGRDDDIPQSPPKEVQQAVTEAYHNLVHYLFLRNDRPEITDDVFLLTIDNRIEPDLHGIRREMSFRSPHYGEVGFRLHVECSAETLEQVRARLSTEIVSINGV